MTSIKPPGGKPPVDGSALGAQGPVEAGPSAPAGDARPVEALEGPDGATAAQGAPASAIDALSADVASGKLSADAALEALIQRVVADVGNALSPAQHQELEATLRAALAGDPTLLSLRRDLEGQG